MKTIKPSAYLLLSLSIFLGVCNATIQEQSDLKASYQNDTNYINQMLKQSANAQGNNLILADSLAKVSLNKSSEQNYLFGIGRSYLNLANSELLRNNNKKAILLFHKSLPPLQELNDSFTLHEVYKGLGLSLAFESHFDSALLLLNKGYQYAKTNQLKKSTIEFDINLYKYYKSKGQFRKGLIYLEEAENILLDFNHPELQIETTNLLGSYYYYTGNYKKAIEFLFKNLNQTKQSTNRIEAYRLYNYLGEVYFYLKDYNSAMQYHQKAFAEISNIYNKTLASYFRGNSYINLGKLYTKLQNSQKALDFLSMAEQNQEIRKDLHAYSAVFHMLGEVYFMLSDHKNALKNYNKSLEITKITKEINTKQEVLLGLGKTYYKMLMPKKAKYFLLESIKFPDEELSPESASQTFLLLSKIYQQEKNYKEAFTYTNRHKITKDILYNEDNIRRVTQLELEYAFELKEKQLKFEQEQERSNLQAKIQFTRLIRNSAIAGFFSIAIITLILLRNYRNRKKSDQEKEILLKEIHHRVKNNFQVISSLLSLQTAYIEDKKVLAAFSESQRRVKSMALIHQMLYQNERFSEIDINNYIQKLIEVSSDSFSNLSEKITITTEIPTLALNIDIATPLGLIINELLTNSFKYAFSEISKGKIHIKIEHQAKDDYLLSYSDNGIGLPEQVLKGNSNSLGINLVKMLSRQIKASLLIENKKGCIFQLKFSKNPKTKKKESQIHHLNQA